MKESSLVSGNVLLEANNEHLKQQYLISQEIKGFFLLYFLSLYDKNIPICFWVVRLLILENVDWEAS